MDISPSALHICILIFLLISLGNIVQARPVETETLSVNSRFQTLPQMMFELGLSAFPRLSPHHCLHDAMLRVMVLFKGDQSLLHTGTCLLLRLSYICFHSPCTQARPVKVSHPPPIPHTRTRDATTIMLHYGDSVGFMPRFRGCGCEVQHICLEF